MSIEPASNHQRNQLGLDSPRTPDEVLAQTRPFDWEAWQALGDELTDDEADAFLIAIRGA